MVDTQKLSRRKTEYVVQLISAGIPARLTKAQNSLLLHLFDTQNGNLEPVNLSPRDAIAAGHVNSEQAFYGALRSLAEMGLITIERNGYRNEYSVVFERAA